MRVVWIKGYFPPHISFLLLMEAAFALELAQRPCEEPVAKARFTAILEPVELVEDLEADRLHDVARRLPRPKLPVNIETNESAQPRQITLEELVHRRPITRLRCQDEVEGVFHLVAEEDASVVRGGEPQAVGSHVQGEVLGVELSADWYGFERRKPRRCSAIGRRKTEEEGRRNRN